MAPEDEARANLRQSIINEEHMFFFNMRYIRDTDPEGIKSMGFKTKEEAYEFFIKAAEKTIENKTKDFERQYLQPAKG
jgi:hypothetical protein